MKDRPSSSVKADRLVFLLLSSIILVYVVIRAASIPWVHDESTTMYWYVERGEFLPYRSLWDAGNHFLSSAIGIIAYGTWGLSLLGSRIGSVIAFILFAWAIHGLGGHFHDRVTRWIAQVALLMCPFLLDFFSLFRGYGLAMAFWSIAIDGLIRFSRSRRPIHLVQLLGALFLADMAVLSLVPLWALVVAAIGVIEIHRWRKHGTIFPRQIAGIWALLGVLPLLLGLLLAWELRRRGALYHGSTEGFIDVTMRSLSKYVLGSDHIVVIVSTLAILGAALVLLVKQRDPFPARLIAGLLLSDVIMRIGMALILNVNYPEDRAALHMVPLVILFVAFSADRYEGKWKWVLIVPLLFLPLRTVVTANFDHTLLWPEQSVPSRFLRSINDLQQQQERPIIIGAYHQLSFAIPYAAKLLKLDLQPPDVIGFPEGAHEVRIVDDRFLPQAGNGYRRIDRSEGNGLSLLVREQPLQFHEVDRSIIVQTDPKAEFIELWRGNEIMMANDLRFRVRTSIGSVEDHLQLNLVASQQDKGTSVYYNSIPVTHFRTKWSGEEMDITINFPALGADEKVVYLWNVARQQIEMGPIEVDVQEVGERGKMRR